VPAKARKRPPPKPPRPDWLTAEAEAEVIASVEAGNTVTTAVAAAGIDPADLYLWAAEGKARVDAGVADAVFTGFCAALSTARAKAEQAMVEALTADAKGGFLTRRYTKEYPNGDTEVDETYSPPNARAALEWMKARNGQQWGKPEAASDMLGGEGAVSGAPGQEQGTIEALAGRLHKMLTDRAEETPQDDGPAVIGVVLPPDPEPGG
jgi:hypothetical protein